VQQPRRQSPPRLRAAAGRTCDLGARRRDEQSLLRLPTGPSDEIGGDAIENVHLVHQQLDEALDLARRSRPLRRGAHVHATLHAEHVAVVLHEAERCGGQLQLARERGGVLVGPPRRLSDEHALGELATDGPL